MKQKRWISIVLLCCLLAALLPGKALAAEETIPMYRLYNPNSGEHFYTGSYEERDMLVEAGWNYEGVAWNAPLTAGDPVYRVFNPNYGDHHYTMDAAERDWLVSLGWQYEGVAWNSYSEAGIPQFRLWNPNADLGSHHYTSSLEERDFLISVGWIPEGIGWYGSSVSSHAHSWSDWETVKEATAVVPGEQKRTCSVCSVVEIQKIEPTGFLHNWQKVWYPEEGHYGDTYCVCKCRYRFSQSSEWSSLLDNYSGEDLVFNHTSWGTAQDWIVDSPEHTEWVCSECGTSTETPDCLHDWEKTWHPEEGHYGETYCKCLCGAKFSTPSDWQAHVESIHDETIVNHTNWYSMSDWIVDSPEYTEWRCSGCGQIVEVLAVPVESNPEESAPVSCQHSWQKFWHPEEGHYSDPYVLCTCGAKFQTQFEWLDHVKSNASEAVDFHTSWSEACDWIVDSPEYTEWVCSQCGEATTTQP